MEELPVYIPRPKICRMAQYHCCKHHRDCPLYPRCSQIQFQNNVCCQDCPSCTYRGCSLTPQQRQEQPVYIGHVIQQERLDLNLEARRWQEQQIHRKRHQKLWVYYNSLFGDFRERRNQQQRLRYWKDPEHRRMLARRSYQKHHSSPVRNINPAYVPECGLDCFNCPHEDCTLPENWLKQAYQADFVRKNPDYFANYRETHREELREKDRLYYEKNKDKISKRQQAHRQKPEVKAQRAAYDKQYNKDHPESLKRRKQKYCATHRDQVNAYKRDYHQKHRDKLNPQKLQYYWEHHDEISAKRKQRYLEKKKAEQQKKEENT